MQALRLVEERRLELASLPEPPPPEGDQVVVRMQALALNHIDVWGHRGMAFARRQLPLTVGVEGAGTITLPLYLSLSDEQQSHVINVVKNHIAPLAERIIREQ